MGVLHFLTYLLYKLVYKFLMSLGAKSLRLRVFTKRSIFFIYEQPVKGM